MKLLNGGYQRELASMVYKFFKKKAGSGASVREHLAQEIHEPVIKKLKIKRVYARFLDNNWTADLDGMRSLSSKNRDVKYLLSVIQVFIKYAWKNPLKDKKAKTILNDFIKIVNEFNCKPNKLWVGEESEFYSSLMQKLLENSNILVMKVSQ